MRKVKITAGFLLLIVTMTVPTISTYGQSASIKASDNRIELTKDRTAPSSAAVDTAVKAATDDPNYIIGPQDELLVSVWKEPEISRSVPVRPDGKISLALLNDVQATGLTPMQLGSAITEKLKNFISEPQVTVIVLTINSQRIFIVGEVARAGIYTLAPNMTALEAISTAGGFSPFAKRTKVFILRKENGTVATIPFNYKQAVRSHRPELDIVLKPGDRIVVP
jgi:polysaccharide export outer membrane protein